MANDVLSMVFVK